MKTRVLAAAALAALLPATGALAGSQVAISVPAKTHSAHPTIFFGIAAEFGDTVKTPDVGVTAKVLTSNRPHQFVLGAGLSYFPWSGQPLGFDLDAGYNFNHFGILGGYDVLRWKPQVSAGFVATDKGGKYCTDPYTDMINGRCYRGGIE